MSDAELPFNYRHERDEQRDDFDLAALSTVPTQDKKRSHLSDERAREILNHYYAGAGLTSRADKMQWLATLVRYLWENGTSPYASYKPERWGNVTVSLRELLPLRTDESIRQFGRSAIMNSAAYHVAQNPSNRPWILAHARAKNVSDDNAAIAFDFYDRSTYPVPRSDNAREVDRSASRALRNSSGQVAPERVEGSQAYIVRDEEHMF
jgi:hypothetical protein